MVSIDQRAVFLIFTFFMFLCLIKTFCGLRIHALHCDRSICTFLSLEFAKLLRIQGEISKHEFNVYNVHITKGVFRSTGKIVSSACDRLVPF